MVKPRLETPAQINIDKRNTKPFLQGLSTKSDEFQSKFFEIIDDICEYFDIDEEKVEFQKYIEENHSYDKPENVLYSSKVLLCE